MPEMLQMIFMLLHLNILIFAVIPRNTIFVG